MKRALNQVIRFAIDQVKRNKFIQNIFEAPFDMKKFRKSGVFIDSFGNTFEMLEGLRTKIRPGWEQMLTVSKTEITRDFLNRQKQHGEIAVSKIVPLLETFGKRIEASTIVEVGCHSGATSFSLAEAGAEQVIGTEFSGYKVKAVETGSEKIESKLEEVNDDLKQIRSELGSLFSHTDRVTFMDDDICHSGLPTATFDVVCSWEVLEHVHDPEKAFASMYRILKPDGVMIHEYNPFFCLNGGHSLCTLDMLWGHTRLNDSDFVRYIEMNRPYERERALSFFRNGLNRMTLRELQEQLQRIGFETISIIPFAKEQHVRMLDSSILRQTQRHYPNATMLDLVSPRIFVLARKGA